MDRAAYERYVSCFNSANYDGVFDFYDENPRLSFFGVEIVDREGLKRFYSFLHSYVRETVTVERFAASEEMLAIEGIVRVEGLRDLDSQTLEANGCGEFFPIKAGEVHEMRQYIHYHLRGGKITSVGCAIVP